MRGVVALALLLGLAACGPRPVEQSDWEQEHLAQTWREEKIVLPPYPSPAGLVEFSVPQAAGFRFYVDGKTLSVGDDGVVRYALVARSREGAENVSFEGLRCATREYRIYAVGDAGRRWSGRPGAWRPIGLGGASPWRFVLHRDYLCRGKQPVRDAAEGLQALRKGVPWYRDAD